MVILATMGERESCRIAETIGRAVDDSATMASDCTVRARTPASKAAPENPPGRARRRRRACHAGGA